MKKLLILFLCLMPMLVFATEMKSEENDPVGIETTTMKLRSIGYLHSDAVPKRYLYQDDKGVGVLPLSDMKAENYRMTGIYKGDVLRGGEGGRYGNPNLY